MLWWCLCPVEFISNGRVKWKQSILFETKWYFVWVPAIAWMKTDTHSGHNREMEICIYEVLFRLWILRPPSLIKTQWKKQRQKSTLISCCTSGKLSNAAVQARMLYISKTRRYKQRVDRDYRVRPVSYDRCRIVSPWYIHGNIKIVLWGWNSMVTVWSCYVNVYLRNEQELLLILVTKITWGFIVILLIVVGAKLSWYDLWIRWTSVWIIERLFTYRYCLQV